MGANGQGRCWGRASALAGRAVTSAAHTCCCPFFCRYKSRLQVPDLVELYQKGETLLDKYITHTMKFDGALPLPLLLLLLLLLLQQLLCGQSLFESQRNLRHRRCGWAVAGLLLGCCWVLGAQGLRRVWLRDAAVLEAAGSAGGFAGWHLRGDAWSVPALLPLLCRCTCCCGGLAVASLARWRGHQRCQARPVCKRRPIFLPCRPRPTCTDINTAFDLLHSGKCLRCVLTFDQ